MENLLEFAERLQELMIENDLNQTELAEKINADSSTISRYLSKQQFPEVAIIIRIADYFDCSIDFLVGTTEIAKKENVIFKECPPFSVQFKRLVAYMKISKYKLQREVNLAKTVMYYWETGKYQPTIENLLKIANKYNYSLDFILGRVDYD